MNAVGWIAVGWALCLLWVFGVAPAILRRVADRGGTHQ